MEYSPNTPSKKPPINYNTKHITFPIKIIKNNTTIIKLSANPNYNSNSNNNSNNVIPFTYSTLNKEQQSTNHFQRSISEKVIKLNKHNPHIKYKKPIYKKKSINGKYPLFNGNVITKTFPDKKRTIEEDCNISYRNELMKNASFCYDRYNNSSLFQNFTFDFCRKKHYENNNNLSVNISINKDECNSKMPLIQNESQVHFIEGVNQCTIPVVNPPSGLNQKNKERNIMFSPIQINNVFRNQIYKEIKDKVSGGSYLGINYQHTNNINDKTFKQSKYDLSFDFNKTMK